MLPGYILGNATVAPCDLSTSGGGTRNGRSGIDPTNFGVASEFATTTLHDLPLHLGDMPGEPRSERHEPQR
jgi:hypothetical protein